MSVGDRSTFLIVHGADPVRWAKRHNLVPFTAACFKCNAPCSTTLPLVSGPMRGLIAPLCSCGHPYPPYCLALVD